MKSYRIAVFSLVVFLAACASFHQEEIPQISQISDSSTSGSKPSVCFDFDFYRGGPSSANPIDIDAAEEKLTPVLKRVVSESELFGEVTYDEFDKENFDYTIRIRAFNHGDSSGAAVGGFITGLTLGIIPSAATDNYTVVFEIFDHKGNILEKGMNKDSITTWFGIWFIPLAGKTVDKAIEASFENQIKDVLKQAFESGSIDYSSPL